MSHHHCDLVLDIARRESRILITEDRDFGEMIVRRRLEAPGIVLLELDRLSSVAEAEFVFGRHTGVTLEPRSIVADWNPGEQRLTVYQGTQAPHMMQNIFALHLGLSESQVRVVCKDVGGSFGIKVHVYADDMATAALSKLLRRPVITNRVAATELGVSPVAAQTGIDRLVAAGVLEQSGGGARNRRWAAPEVLTALDDFAARALRGR